MILVAVNPREEVYELVPRQVAKKLTARTQQARVPLPEVDSKV